MRPIKSLSKTLSGAAATIASFGFTNAQLSEAVAARFSATANMLFLEDGSVPTATFGTPIKAKEVYSLKGGKAVRKLQFFGTGVVTVTLLSGDGEDFSEGSSSPVISDVVEGDVQDLIDASIALITPASIAAATTAQGTKADNAETELAAKKAISVVATGGAAQTLNVNTHRCVNLNMTATCTLTLTDPATAGIYELDLYTTQGGAGNWDLVFPAAVLFPTAGTQPVPTKTAGVVAHWKLTARRVSSTTTWDAVLVADDLAAAS